MMAHKITAGILSAGKGTRFMPDKGLLRIGHKTIIERQLAALNAIFVNIVIVTNSPDLYKGFKTEIISDVVLDKGPLGGIYSVLKHIKTHWSFILASDMPYPSGALIKYILRNLKGADAVVPEFNGSLEPLFACYSKDCLEKIDKQFKDGNLKVADLFSQIRLRVIREKEISRFDPAGLSFLNINTKEDYKKVIKKEPDYVLSH